ncbi:MAG TPA: flagellar basal body P-ring protein FlgI [Candidatus Brocadiia bacterium]|nr:flagellar basal body P-ring protein FlgI [Candidatus Brocadiia bacterium]
MNPRTLPAILAAALAALASGAAHAELSVRIKDLARVSSVRSNQLYGIGIVVGLNGTGDDTKFSRQLLSNVLGKQNVNISPDQLSAKNVAVVMLPADVPPFIQVGDTMDVTVSSMGDATSLQGGVLLQAPLMGANKEVYAVCQGAISLGGYSVTGQAATLTKNHPTSGRIPNGAILERKITMLVSPKEPVRMVLRDPDFATALRMAEAINKAFPGAAVAQDAAVVRVTPPREFADYDRVTEFIASVQKITVVPDNEALVVINERTGTVVVGEHVQLSRVAICHGSLTISVKETEKTSQPNPFSSGQTATEKSTDIQATEGKGNLIVMEESPKLQDIARAMTLLGVSPRDMVAIFQALKRAGALKASLLIM